MRSSASGRINVHGLLLRDELDGPFDLCRISVSDLFLGSTSLALKKLGREGRTSGIVEFLAWAGSAQSLGRRSVVANASASRNEGLYAVGFVAFASRAENTDVRGG